MSLPRLTGALRAFSDVAASEPVATESSAINRQKELQLKRQQAKQTSSQSQAWKRLVDTIQKKTSVSQSEVTAILRELLNATRQIAGKHADPELAEEGATFLFLTFLGHDHVSHSMTQTLSKQFGPFPASAANKACDAVAEICSWLPYDTIENIPYLINEDKSESGVEFGNGIKFVYPSAGPDLNYDWLEEKRDTDTSGSSFDMVYKQSKAVIQPISKDNKAEKDDDVDGGWLKRQVEKAMLEGGSDLAMSVNDLCTTLFDILCSPMSDSELQNELFEFLGVDRLDLIGKLIQRRKKLIDAALKSVSDFTTVKTASKRMDGERPNYACQVTVQTTHELQQQKKLRKEDKRQNKRLDIKENEHNLTALGFNPQELRAQREAALRSAAAMPVFPSRSQPSQQPEVYPNVYDSYAEAKQSSSFIGGAKMILPVGFERRTNKLYEEVDIPPSDPPPVDVGRKLVSISTLDEIGQMAFQGTKTLNRIQSVVFDTAYKNNDNLLICAPTGAGKTNIAMLCVLHELKQHVSQGVIKKDEFKIIYVAPMKALAAEMVANFGRRLQPLGISVRELTGDMQLTKAEIMKTQMLVTTPEKWDVVTRKSTGDVALTQIVKLLIIDEVHLLHDDRGAVIESLVARTKRQVESSQSMIRIVGLSATLPNYIDVARFLSVNPYTGLFFFDGRFRPVPLAMAFVGIRSTNRMQQLQDFNTVCYEKVLDQIRKGYQVMVFVHARNETVKTAMTLAENARNCGDDHLFSCQQLGPRYGDAEKQLSRSRNKQLRELFPQGFGIHHAGMLRQDRNLVEKFFGAGLMKVLVCTATLAWGVNLPAHAVIIKGTQLYDAKKGSFVDLGILDVMQIFGRAGRPQFDTFGHGTIITAHDKLSHYLSLLTRQNPIESTFISSLTDNLNAEVSLGTVTNLEEAVKWLSYTYLYVRMRYNPLVYGIGYQDLQDDPTLERKRQELITIAARALDKARMVRFEERTGYISSTDFGRIASHFYIKYDTVEVVNEMFNGLMTEDRVLEMVSKSQEFQQIKVREEELDELDFHLSETCMLPVAGGSENTYGKVNILLQTYVSRGNMESFSLVSDLAYVAQNSTRIVRALFEMALRKGWPVMAGRLLQLSKVLEKRMWGHEHPLRQFPVLSPEIIHKLEARKLYIDKLKEMDSKDIGHLIHHVRMGSNIKECVHQIPSLILDATIQPITRTVLRVKLSITPDFRWHDKVHGTSTEAFWIWVEDPEDNQIHHSEYFLMHRKQARSMEPQLLVFTIPLVDPLPTQYYVRAISDRWLGSESVCPISFKHLILPDRHPPHTELLDLQPLPITALHDPCLESLYSFTHFNPIQTQVFHSLYNTDCNVLIGAPTGSGKTITAELAIFRLFREYPKSKAVYIAPLKALVRERMTDWKVRIEEKLGKKVVELTGDVTPDMRAVAQASLIVTTPEKWDGVSRSWQTRSYVKSVNLLVIDEIHLLGDERGPVLEVIVSRTNFISSHTTTPVRVVGLSTALANARDLADWLGIKQMGLYNFRPSVRPVPLEVHISGYPGKHYCPRMATMNKPTFQAVRTHSPAKPVLVFVSSRRQTRLTALDLIAYLAAEDDPKQWLHLPEMEMEHLITAIRDQNLKLTLAFGIGLHHAGLHERDRKTVEELFINQKIQVLIATSTLAWGVNFPAHLVVVKGTEYFDGKTRRYVDFPITDVLQMMGRAGRPQFDDSGKAVILVHDVKKHFYKKFLYDPFPVESNLLEVLTEHLNAEVVAGTVTSKQDAIDYLTWTFFFRRLLINPSYYNLEDTNHGQINRFLSSLVETCAHKLQSAYCLEIGEDSQSIQPTTLGRIASYYYLHHTTVQTFRDQLGADSSIEDLLTILSSAHEYSDLPVRHNEDQVNSELAQNVPLSLSSTIMDTAKAKTHLLLQAHFSQIQLPSSDYHTDTKSVLDQAIRVLQAMLDISADQGWLVTSLRTIQLLQMVIQGLWYHDNTLLMLPHIQTYHCFCFRHPGGASRKQSPPIDCLPELMHVVGDRYQVINDMLKDEMTADQIGQIVKVLQMLPQIRVELSMRGWWEGGSGQQENRHVPQDGGLRRDADWMVVHADQEYVLNINLSRINGSKRSDSKAYTPRFGKPKDEGWFLVLGEVEGREVVALKRVGTVRGRSKLQLAFYTPETTGRVIYTLYLMSDCYLGLDQQYDIRLDVIPASIEAQVNTELMQELGDLDIDPQEEVTQLTLPVSNNTIPTGPPPTSSEWWR